MKYPRKHLSHKQIAANLANAQHSTGPRTAEGKAVSARNAVRHGFTASTFNVLRLESLEEVAHLKADLVAAYQPVNSQELLAVERMAIAQQSILRASRLEAGMFASAMDKTMWNLHASPGHEIYQDLTKGITITAAQNRNYFCAEGIFLMSQKSNCWSLFLRYQAQAERLYRRALEEFERLKALRPEMPVEDVANDRIPNEPISTNQPQQNKPDLPPQTNPSGAPSEPPEGGLQSARGLSPDPLSLNPGKPDLNPASDPPNPSAERHNE